MVKRKNLMLCLNNQLFKNIEHIKMFSSHLTIFFGALPPNNLIPKIPIPSCTIKPTHSYYHLFITANIIQIFEVFFPHSPHIHFISYKSTTPIHYSKQVPLFSFLTLHASFQKSFLFPCKSPFNLLPDCSFISTFLLRKSSSVGFIPWPRWATTIPPDNTPPFSPICLLYTSDAADERSSVDLGGRRIIKKKNKS